MADYIWVLNPETGQEERVSYDDLDADIFPQIFKPLGGFCYPVGAFTHLDLPGVPYYIKGWLPKQGKGLLYAPAKAGKSYLSYQIARCIAGEDDFLGIPTAHGKVLILQFELGEKVVQDRLRSTGKDYEDVFIGTSFALKLDSRAGEEQVRRAIEAIKPDVIILDPFYKIIKGDENEAHDVSVITDTLDRMIEDYGCSFFIFHHTGKDISKGGRGSSVLEDWVDSYLEMRRTRIEDDPTGLHIRITPKLLRHSEPEPPVDAVLRNFEFELETPKPTKKEEIKSYFVTHPHDIITTQKLLIENLGSRKTISDALEELLRMGVVVRLGRGQYQLAGGGQPMSEVLEQLAKLGEETVDATES